MAAPDLLGDEQKACFDRQLRRRHGAGKTRAKVHLARADRLAKRLAGDVGLIGLRLGQGREQLRGARMVAAHRRGARLDIGSRRVRDVRRATAGAGTIATAASAAPPAIYMFG